MKLTRSCRPPRVQTAFWGEVEPAGKGSCKVLVEELVTTGLSFRCDRETSFRLMPSRQKAPGTLLGIRVRLRFSLPGPGKPLEVPCRVVFCRRFSQDSFRFDCLFDPKDTLQQQRIERFILRQSRDEGSPGTGEQESFHVA